jgi:hypothetical protein
MDARTMFRQIITPITTSLTKRESHKPIFATLFLPSIFDHDIRDVATDVVFEGAYLQRTLSSKASTSAERPKNATTTDPKPSSYS